MERAIALAESLAEATTASDLATDDVVDAVRVAVHTAYADNTTAVPRAAAYAADAAAYVAYAIRAVRVATDGPRATADAAYAAARAGERAAHAAKADPSKSAPAFGADTSYDAQEAYVKSALSDYLQLQEQYGQADATLGDPIDFKRLGRLWPTGEPRWARASGSGFVVSEGLVVSNNHVLADHDAMAGEVGPPSLIIAWAPDLLSEDDYARLVTALGDVVREEGGVGIKRLQSRGFGVPVDAGVLR
jgi:S1-C subfamily serine protease